jgi:hypothetical protein
MKRETNSVLYYLHQLIKQNQNTTVTKVRNIMSKYVLCFGML